MRDRVKLSSLPAEVVLSVFCSLSTFPDILHLAATCQKHRQVFHENVITIYNHVSPRAIPPRRYARKLLADQGGSLPNETPTAQDLLQMTRNSIVIEKSVDHFNKTVVIMMRQLRAVYPYDKRFFNGNEIRPPYLTKRERSRFIRAAYELWSIILLDSTLKELRINTLKYKDVYALMQFAHLERWTDDMLILDKEILEIQKADPGVLDRLEHIELREAEERIFAKLFYDRKSHTCWNKEDGWMGCVTICENWIEEFKASVVVD